MLAGTRAKRGSSSIVQRQRRFLRRDLELEPRPARHRAPGASAEANGASAEHDLGAGWPEQLEAVSVGYQTSAAIVNERTDPLRLSRSIGWCLRRAPSTSARSRSMLVLEEQDESTSEAPAGPEARVRVRARARGGLARLAVDEGVGADLPAARQPLGRRRWASAQIDTPDRHSVRPTLKNQHRTDGFSSGHLSLSSVQTTTVNKLLWGLVAVWFYLFF